MKYGIKIIQANNVEGVQKRANDWLKNFDGYIVDMRMATYPGASTGLTFLYRIEEDEGENNEPDSGMPVPTRPTPPFDGAETSLKIPKPFELPPTFKTTEQRVAERIETATVSQEIEDGKCKPCGCKLDEMCQKCDDGTPLTPGLAKLVQGLPPEILGTTDVLGANDEVLSIGGHVL